MRALILVLFLITLADSICAGVNDTYDELKTTEGMAYKGCTVTKVEPDGLTIMYSDGAIKIPFAKLPADIQQKYNFDSATAEAYATEQAAKRKAQIQANLDALDQKQKSQAQDKDVQKKRGQLLAGKAALVGSVLSKTKDGLLVQCDEPQPVASGNGGVGGGGVYVPAPSGLNAPNAYGLFFLRGHPAQSTLVDGDSISIVAYPDGTYTYKSAIGAVKTVKSYTATAVIAQKETKEKNVANTDRVLNSVVMRLRMC